MNTSLLLIILFVSSIKHFDLKSLMGIPTYFNKHLSIRIGKLSRLKVQGVKLKSNSNNEFSCHQQVVTSDEELHTLRTSVFITDILCLTH